MALRQQYGRCTSFFVESDNDWETRFAKAQEERQKKRATARQRQRDLGVELSNITADEYQDEILEQMEQLEGETLPDVTFIDMQTEIQWSMRPYLLDFLVEAHASFQLLPETLYLAVNILDRYCSKRVVYKRHYQLVGCAALLIASKYGDRKERVPIIKELKSMCCSVYEEEMFTQMEWHVLTTLDWQIGHPTVASYLQILLSEEAPDPQVEHLASLICENALYHRELLSIPSSVLSRSGLALARRILAKEVDNTMYWSGQYEYPVFLELYHFARNPSRVLASKYSTPHTSSVAQTLELFVMRQDHFERANAPVTPPIGAPQNTHVNVAPPTLVLPSTPQKGHPISASAYGYMTPPITPDGPQCGQHQAVKAQQHTWRPSTYTPPPSADAQFYSRPEVHRSYSSIHCSGPTYYGH